MTLDNNQELTYKNSQSFGQPGLSLSVNSSNPFGGSGLNLGQGSDNTKMLEAKRIGEIVPGRVANIKVIGVGGGGGNAVNRMIESELGLTFYTFRYKHNFPLWYKT